MQSRMEHLAREKAQVEEQVTKACIKIQSYVRMRQQRKAYLKSKEENQLDDMTKLTQ